VVSLRDLPIVISLHYHGRVQLYAESLVWDNCTVYLTFSHIHREKKKSEGEQLHRRPVLVDMCDPYLTHMEAGAPTPRASTCHLLQQARGEPCAVRVSPAKAVPCLGCRQEDGEDREDHCHTPLQRATRLPCRAWVPSVVLRRVRPSRRPQR
jgi:hypothetical protein